MDSYLDSLQRQFIQLIFESHAGGRIDLQVAVQLAVVARFYERIGDHAVNISERVATSSPVGCREHGRRAMPRRSGRLDAPGFGVRTRDERRRSAAAAASANSFDGSATVPPRERDEAEAERHRLRTALDALRIGIVLAGRHGYEVRNAMRGRSPAPRPCC